MFIQTETTPNPHTMKFLPGVAVMEKGTATFINSEQAKKSALAEALFSIKNIEGVFFGSDFITVTREPNANWSTLKAPILTTIMEHFISGAALLREGSEKEISPSSSASGDDNDIVAQIKELIDSRVRPAVAEDGGDIIFHSFDNGIVKLELHGACSGCPSSTMTLKNGIENLLRHYIPEVESVEAVTE